MADGKSYGTSYFTPRNILIYLVIGTIVYAAIYFFFLKKDNASLYSYPPSQSSQDANATSMTVSLGARNDSGESGTATLTVSLASLKGQLPLAINVHKSGSEANVYVSCGDLK
ncbi:MAG: hypothetical protein HYV40_00560 [Candidatus Levybacteria bacterium]|nr:hypothetical protein [Candidatus Levybacteria bacterium]